MNEALGENLGVEQRDSQVSLKEVAERARQRMVNQVHTMVRSTMISQRESAAPPATVAIGQATAQRGVERMANAREAHTEVTTDSPYDDVPTEDCGKPADDRIR